MDSTLAVPTNQAENDYIGGLFAAYKWLGISDTQNEGQWVSDIDGSPISWNNWYTNQPNGGIWENYALIGYEDYWFDKDGTGWYESYVCQAMPKAVEYTYSTINRDYNIGKIGSTVSPTFKETILDECKNICNNDTNCLAFTRDTSVGNGNNGRCWFHDHIHDYGCLLYTSPSPRD